MRGGTDYLVSDSRERPRKNRFMRDESAEGRHEQRLKCIWPSGRS